MIDKSGRQTFKSNEKVEAIVDNVKEHLNLVSQGKIDQIETKAKDEYKKRKLLHDVNFTAYKISKGPNFTTTIEKPVTELTPEMISNGSWKTANFKPYNFEALGINSPCRTFTSIAQSPSRIPSNLFRNGVQ